MKEFLVDTPLTKNFEVFVRAERDQYNNEDNNRVAFSLSQVGRYLRMAEIARLRVEAVVNSVTAQSQDRMESLGTGRRQLTAKEISDFDMGWRYQLLSHMELEIYFIFTKILLDKISQCIEDFFGQARSITLKSHRMTCKNLTKYAELKNLTIPDGYMALAQQILDTIVEYRDKQITHLKNPRALHASLIHPDLGVQISISALYPKPTDKSTASPSWSETHKLIEDFVSMFADLIATNRTQNRYGNSVV